ncbi:MAG TPA: DNA repair protein RecO [Verrucomicrobiae bacterium]|nr:DNA repair protein RecO [Verrucomicrobiae bacterium]
MIQSATGLILRTRPLTETSLIVHWLTADFGRIATVAKGARRPKSPFLGKLDLFYVADFSFSRSRRSDLHLLREVGLRELHAALRQNLASLRQATYATAFVEQATETETPLPGVYGSMLGFLDYLCKQAVKPQSVFAFELKLLHELGLEPDWGKTGLTPGSINIGRSLAQGGWRACKRLKLSHVQILELQEFLHGFLIFHLGRLPKGRAAALAGQDSE